MKKIVKDEPPPHLMIVDTNILWHKDKSLVVSPEFDKFWEEHTKLVILELVLPEVVKSELLFQQTTSAVKALEKAVEAMAEVSSITEHNHKLHLSKHNIRKQVEEKIDRWLKLKKATVAPTPFDTIEWNTLCNAAVWREPPFTFDPKNSENEKGFRDALILETVLECVKQEKRSVHIAFVCNDFLLRKTASERLADDKRVSCYETLEGFSSYIKLTKEKLTDQFIKAILQRATKRFFNIQKVNSLYHKEKINERIQEQFKELFNYPERSDQSGNVVSYGGLMVSLWEPLNSGRWWMTIPEFVKLEDDKIFYWKNRVQFIRQYTKSNNVFFITAVADPQRSLLPQQPTKKTLFLGFDVYWKTKVTADAKFHDVVLVDVLLAGNSFRHPSESEMRDYQLRAGEEY